MFQDEILECVKCLLRSYYYESLLNPKTNEGNQYSDIKSNKRRKVESGQLTKTLSAINDNTFLNLLKRDECKNYIEDTDKRKQQDMKYVSEASVNCEIFPDFNKNENKGYSYTNQPTEIKDSDNIISSMKRVPRNNTVNNNKSILELTSQEEKLISTSNSLANAPNLKTCNYKFNTENIHIAATLNDTLSSTSKKQIELYESCGQSIEYIENVQVETFSTKINQSSIDDTFTENNNKGVVLNNHNNCDEKLINSKNPDFLKTSCNNAKNIEMESEVNDDDHVKNIKMLNKENESGIKMLPISQWSKGDVFGTLQVSTINSCHLVFRNIYISSC